ncbi:MAG: NifB/NifX family molybdenum-iron cluster-binding protein [Candidatus Hydrogenedentales bacterium]|jgi:predicted Fe-Mo cluster-binding NifX family protein
MKVAIPEWQGRISPVFDVAATLVVTDLTADGQAAEQHSIRLFRNDLHGRVMEMAGLGIDVLVCGAISWPLEMALSNAGIEVIPHTCGEVQSVLESYMTSRLNPNTFLMPGCCGRRRRHRGQGRRGRTRI